MDDLCFVAYRSLGLDGRRGAIFHVVGKEDCRMERFKIELRIGLGFGFP